MTAARRRVVILGAAGRDFHDFNVLYRDDAARYEYRETESPGLGERVDAFLAERGLGGS